MGITPAELWEKDPEQINLMVAHAEVEHETGPHGMPMSEATDPRANPNYYGDGSFGYEAALVEDWAQYAIELEYQTVQEANPDADLKHLRPVVHRVDY